MYRIQTIVLDGHKHLLLNDIRVFRYSPQELIQIILGTNGSGKSSLLRELTPLPADKKHYAKDGSKVVTLIQRGSTFVLTSRFANGAKHSFMKNDEELNVGGTERVQRELVKEYFGTTEDSHNLMRGVEKFSDMSPSKRREWFTRLSVSDYTFAMSAFEQLSVRHRDVAGALKRNSVNLVAETAKIISSEDEERLTSEVNELLNELNILMEERMPLDDTPRNFQTNLDRTLHELKELSSRLLRVKIVAPLEYNDGRMERDDWGELKRTSFHSIEEVDEEITRLRHLVTAKEAVIQQTTEQHNKLQHNYDILMKTGQDGVRSLMQQLADYGKQILDAESKMRLGLVFNQPLAAQEALESIAAPLRSLFSEIPTNDDRRFGMQKLRELQNKLVEMEQARNNLQVETNQLQAKKDHADEHRNSGKMQCPQCRHTFVAGIHEDQYERLKKAIADRNGRLAEMAKEREEVVEKVREMEAYFAQYREYLSFSKNVAVLNPFWQHLNEGQYVLDRPREVLSLLNHLERDLELSVIVEQLNAKMVETQKLQQAAEQVGDANLQDVQEELEGLTRKLGMLTSQLTHLGQAVAEYSDYRRVLQQNQAMGDRIKELYANAHTLYDGYVEALRRESIAMCIQQVQQTLAMKQESLRHAQMQKTIVAKLEEQIKELAVEEEAAREMVRALSPKHGLIAEGLLGFIRSFVGQMNNFIRKIWTYPMQIVPTGFSEEGESSTELDYKFKMIVGDYNNVVPDVGDASEGQKEVVDLAFKITAMPYLGLSETPIMLDEFGKALDDAHRAAATHAIKSMMETHNHTQLFMVSHHIHLHGSFTNADYCVLDARNLALPAGLKYNQHVKMH